MNKSGNDGGGYSGRILIVEDESDLADVYGQILGKDYEIVIMTSGRQALELLLKDNTFDVIFSDLSLGDIGGMDIYLELKRLGNENREKIVFITGVVFLEKIENFLKTIPNKIAEKPLSSKSLRELAQEAILKRKKTLFKAGK